MSRDVVIWAGLAYSVDEWAVIAAVSTAAAAIIALLTAVAAIVVPLAFARADRRRAADEAARRYAEVVAATRDALKIFRGFYDAIQYPSDITTAEAVKATAQARYKADTLDRLASLPQLSDGAIDSLSGGRAVMQLILEIDVAYRNEPHRRGDSLMAATLAVAEQVEQRLNGVIEHCDLPALGAPSTLFVAQEASQPFSDEAAV